jgi:hypothetical protein
VQNVRNAHIDAEHNYNRESREAVYRFLARNLQAGHRPIAEPEDRAISLPPDEDLLAFPKSGPRGLEGYGEVFQAWKMAGSLPLQSHVEEGAQREALRYALGAEWPSQVESSIQGNRAVLSRSGKGDRVTGYWVPGKGAPLLVVHSGGSAAALRTAAVAQMVRSGRPTLVLDTFAGNAARTQKLQFDDYFLSYNRSVYAERVQDILTAAAYLKAQVGGKLEIAGLGDAGVWCIFAAAVAPVAIDVVADLNGFSGSDEDFRGHFFVPGIQRAGGLDAALRLAGSVRTLLPIPDGSRLAPFAELLSTLQEMQQSAQSQGDPAAADRLNRLARDFTDALKSGRLP